MRSGAFIGAALAAIAAPLAAQPAGAPPVMAPPPMAHAMPPMAHPMPNRPRPTMPPPRMAGRHAWAGGMSAPGGWNGYRRPGYGFQLPSYWVAPSFYIGNWNAYGLPRPAGGYGWSRYYDDAVLTDQWGRVYDYRDDVAWDGDRGGYDRDDVERDGDRGGYDRDDRDRDDGDRDEGDRHHGHHHRDGHGEFSYDGRWDGHWAGDVWQGSWSGAVHPHWRSRDEGEGRWRPAGPPPAAYGYGYGSGYGYDAGGTTVTTVVIQPSVPVMTRTVSYETVLVRRAHVRHRAVRPRCGCGS